MSRTVDSLLWELLGCTFKKLETLRVGFGELNANWVTKVLSHCDHTKLKAFGFDWDWQSNYHLVRTFLFVDLYWHAQRQYRARSLT